MRVASLIVASLAASVIAGCAGDRGAESVTTTTAPHPTAMLEVPAEQAPTIDFEVMEDPFSGWNLHLITQRFRFTPEESGKANTPGTGHAHLYLDGEKIARVYSEWYHLNAGDVPAGTHTLTVRLNANDHAAWAVDGQPIEDSVEIYSTGADDHDHDHSGHTPPSPTG